WAFAWTCVDTFTASSHVELAYFTVAERTSLSDSVPDGCTDRLPARVGVSGSVTNLPNTGTDSANYGDRMSTVPRTTGAFSFESPPGPSDLIVTTGGAVTGGSRVSAAARTTATAPTTTATLDWNTSKAVQTAPVTVPTGATFTTLFWSAGGTFL